MRVELGTKSPAKKITDLDVLKVIDHYLLPQLINAIGLELSERIITNTTKIPAASTLDEKLLSFLDWLIG